MEFWKAIENEIFMNSDLDIYEKMCLLVLMSQGEEVHLSSIQLANFMGCGVNTAKRSFESLRLKGYLENDYHASPAIRRESNIIQNEEVNDIAIPVDEISDDFREGFYKTESDSRPDAKANEEVDVLLNHSEDDRRKQMAEYLLGNGKFITEPVVKNNKSKVNELSLVDQVIELIEEKISSKEANIILAFANNDVDKVKKKYKIAKMSQVSDTISVLINELQKKESNVIKTDEVQVSNVENSQINTNRLLKMQAYQNSRLK